MLPDPRAPVEYATKADLLQLRTELQGDIRALRQEMRADLAELRADLSKQIGDLKGTIITTLIAQTAIFGTLVTILKLFT